METAGFQLEHPLCITTTDQLIDAWIAQRMRRHPNLCFLGAIAIHQFDSVFDYGESLETEEVELYETSEFNLVFRKLSDELSVNAAKDRTVLPEWLVSDYDARCMHTCGAKQAFESVSDID